MRGHAGLSSAASQHARASSASFLSYFRGQQQFGVFGAGIPLCALPALASRVFNMLVAFTVVRLFTSVVSRRSEGTQNMDAFFE